MSTPSTRKEKLRLMLESKNDQLQALVDQKYAENQNRDGRVVLPREGFAAMMMLGGAIGNIILALGNLKKDAYGICYKCHGEIPEEQLTEEPLRVRCKGCS